MVRSAKVRAAVLTPSSVGIDAVISAVGIGLGKNENVEVIYDGLDFDSGKNLSAQRD